MRQHVVISLGAHFALAVDQLKVMFFADFRFVFVVAKRADVFLMPFLMLLAVNIHICRMAHCAPLARILSRMSDARCNFTSSNSRRARGMFL